MRDLRDQITRSIELAQELGYDLKFLSAPNEYVPLFLEVLTELKELRKQLKERK